MNYNNNKLSAASKEKGRAVSLTAPPLNILDMCSIIIESAKRKKRCTRPRIQQTQIGYRQRYRHFDGSYDRVLFSEDDQQRANKKERIFYY